MLNVARWRVILVIVVTLLGIAFALPNVLPDRVRENLPAFLPSGTLNLGLDLQGGLHLVLQVQTQDAVRAETDKVLNTLILQYHNVRPTYLGNLLNWGRTLPDRKPKKRKTA